MYTIQSRFKDGPESRTSRAFGREASHELIFEVMRKERLSGQMAVVKRLNDKGVSVLARYATLEEARQCCREVYDLYR